MFIKMQMWKAKYKRVVQTAIFPEKNKKKGRLDGSVS